MKRPTVRGLTSRTLLVALAGAAALACGTTLERETAVARGERVARDSKALTTSRFSAFSCATCHALPGEGASARIYPGAPLAGAAERASFWGGRIATLRDAVGECVVKFQRASSFDVDTPTARDLYAYLTAHTATTPRELPFTIVGVTRDLPVGDAARGAITWENACRTCHGAIVTGAGRLAPEVSLVPNDTVAYHAKDGPGVARLVVIEKVRHGSYLGFAGNMPPFSLEALSDAELADVLAYAGL